MNGADTLLLAARARAIKPSPSMAAKTRVDQLRAQGRDIIDFTVGEPDLPTPAHIVQAGIDALNSGDIRYTASAGSRPLLEAARAKFQRENGLDYAIDELIVGVGAKQLLYTALAATVQAGDEVIIPAPYWVSYPDMVLVNDGTPVVVACPEADGFKLTPEALERAITPRTKWLLLNTPSNPTGAMYSAAELRALADVLARHPQVWLMTDEIYEHLAYGDERHASPAAVAPELASRTLTINGVSKAYAMTGWRLGYAGGPKTLVKAMATLISQSTSCVSAISQAAARVALSADQACVGEAAAVFHARRDRIVTLLDAVPGIRCPRPQGAFYVYPNVEGLLGRRTPAGALMRTDLDVVMFLLDEAGVAVLDGTAYGLSPYLRLSFATSMDNIEEGCRRIAQACGRLT
ncbi:aminotransferase class I/II-fold pyridoxal phosphate-dependent enzyme [Achromobacter xylosoxidans]|uniref:aminotransferase class I/II-fold pyridoxal phosphate-dependent enzyme n=2 Tax=Alcaligenes xylosoxydans xylosoxydans TaxID=85698 RepID=UPI0022B859A0|nr:aminotransferase class I/II-fold pyridoxal phosphate-dependent enzyme [Achromobacter xylosoxidans]MCZ8388390.1 aminotransferase class I/II-fold pyridoxal phosphate-dependent enzyme [Achromobacter xylosoxidans]